MLPRKLDSMSEDASRLLGVVSKAIESKDPAFVFASPSEIRSRLVKLGLADQWTAIAGELAADRPWEAMRKLIGAAYLVTPQRLAADLQAALMHLAHRDADAAVAA